MKRNYNALAPVTALATMLLLGSTACGAGETGFAPSRPSGIVEPTEHITIGTYDGKPVTVYQSDALVRGAAQAACGQRGIIDCDLRNMTVSASPDRAGTLLVDFYYKFNTEDGNDCLAAVYTSAEIYAGQNGIVTLIPETPIYVDGQPSYMLDNLCKRTS